jgi:hypothetical protein
MAVTQPGAESGLGPPDIGGDRPGEREAVERQVDLPTAAVVVPPRPRVLVIVATNRLKLYEYLKEGLAGIAGLEVIVDRRKGADRKPARDQATAPEPDQRRQEPADPELRSRGFVISRPREEGPA